MSRAKSAIEPQALNPVGLAKYLNISRAQVFVLSRRGRIPRPVYVGSLPRWARTEIDAWLAAGAPTRRDWELIKRATKKGLPAPEVETAFTKILPPRQRKRRAKSAHGGAPMIK